MENDENNNVATDSSPLTDSTSSPPPTELEVAKKQAEEYLNGWKRAQADFLNYKKEETKRLSDFMKFANVGMILEMIEILDDLETAGREIKNPGLDQVVKKFQELLKKYEVERIKTDGGFDPEHHEAVSTEPGGEKIEEVRAGYIMNGRVIRPSRIKIIK